MAHNAIHKDRLPIVETKNGLLWILSIAYVHRTGVQSMSMTKLPQHITGQTGVEFKGEK